VHKQAHLNRLPVVIQGLQPRPATSCVFHLSNKRKSKSLRWKEPARIKERLSTSAHTSQSPTGNRISQFKFRDCRR
jgi:hypothetical protein